MSRQENFLELLHKHGYRSITQFCTATGINQSNTNKRLVDDNLNIRMDIMFGYANALHEPIDVIIKALFESQYIENQEIVKKG